MVLYKICLLFLIVFGLNCSTFNQTNNSVISKTDDVITNQTKIAKEWEIVASHFYGRFHQFGKVYTVNSNGNIYFEDKEKKTKLNGEASIEQIKEIEEMLKILDLPSAKSIPDGKYNECIVSPHLPSISFILKENNNSFRLTHCNQSPSEKSYQYTLILTDSQKETYIKLREKVTSLFADMIK